MLVASTGKYHMAGIATRSVDTLLSKLPAVVTSTPYLTISVLGAPRAREDIA